jgi:hypothetical protein
LAARSQAIGEIASSRVRAPFEQALALKAYQITVKGTAVGKGSKQNVHVVWS